MYRLTSNSHAPEDGRHTGVQGFTLIEMLVSTGVTVVFLAGAFTLLGQLTNVSDSIVKMADMNQNLRAATDIMARDLTGSAGGVPIGGIPLPSGAGCTVVNRPGPGLAAPPAPLGPQTFSNCSAGAMGVMPAISPGQQLGPTINGQVSDEVTMISIDQNFAVNYVPVFLLPTTIALVPAACAPPACTGWTLTVPGSPSIAPTMGSPAISNPTAVNVGDIYLFSNFHGMALGMVTAVAATTPGTITFASGDSLGLNQPNAAAGTLSSLGPGGAWPPTNVYKILMVSYYLDNTMAGNPRLMRQLENSPAMEMADRINFLEFSYDLSDGVTTNVRDVLSLAPHTPNEIRKVNISIAANSQTLAQQTSKAPRVLADSINTAVTIRDLAYRNNY
jgi:type II secretory pathway pseudopilin PulG